MPNIFRVRTVFSYGAGSPGLMTTYFTDDVEAFDSTAAQDSVNRVRDAMLTSPTLWPPAFTWAVQGEVDVLDDADGEVQGSQAVTGANGAGTSNVPLGPLPVGLLLKGQTNAFVSGRRLIGRTFFVPVSSALTQLAAPNTGTQAAVVAVGTALLNAGTTTVDPVVWSRPRPATAVGPGRPAGPAREARVGSSAKVVSYSCPAKYVIMASRRD